MTLERLVMEEGVLELLIIGITLFLMYLWKD
jgi:hypothetical protein